MPNASYKAQNKLKTMQIGESLKVICKNPGNYVRYTWGGVALMIVS